MEMYELETRRCPWCHQTGKVIVPRSEVAAFNSGQGHIQDAMPTTPAPIREQIMTGIHPECWDAMTEEIDDQ